MTSVTLRRKSKMEMQMVFLQSCSHLTEIPKVNYSNIELKMMALMMPHGLTGRLETPKTTLNDALLKSQEMKQSANLSELEQVLSLQGLEDDDTTTKDALFKSREMRQAAKILTYADRYAAPHFCNHSHCNHN